MSANLLACVFCLEENQYSVVPATDNVEGSTVKEGAEGSLLGASVRKITFFNKGGFTTPKVNESERID